MWCKKDIIFISLIGLFLYIINILTFVLSLWTNKAIYICYFISVFLFFILYIPFILSFLYICIWCLKNLIVLHYYYKKFLYFGFLLFFIDLIVLSVNISNYRKYLKHCPFTINELDYTLHVKRRCELYNINNNSRLAYQYICSYDPSKDFANNFSEKYKKNDSMVCVPFKTIVPNNDIIYLFSQIYNDSNKYYCSRTNIPTNNFRYINPKYCNNNSKYAVTIIFYTFNLIQILLFLVVLASDRLTAIIFGGIKDNVIEYENYRIRRIHRNIERRINREFQNRTVNIYRFLGNLLNFILRNENEENNENNNNSRISTDISNNGENNSNNINDIPKTRNIIIENQKEISIETNIKDLAANQDNKLSQSIQLEQINIIINSENKKINDCEINNDNKKNNI